MVDNSIKLLVIPPGGWRFEQPIENSGAFLVEGQTYQQLENKVFDFRLANVEIIPGGTATRESVREDLRRFICARFPTQCTGEAPEPRSKGSGPIGYNTPISRLDDWFKKLAFSTIEWADAATAMARAEICVTCPQNIRWQTGCAPCVESVQRRIVRYKGDRSTQLDSKLNACRCFGHHNELAVWIKSSSGQSKEEPPSACWNK